jgi:Uncharacterized stress protein (general stress protein 26)
MSVEKQETETYLNQTKYVTLATVSQEKVPALRALGAFAADGYSVYFNTQNHTEKIRHIEENPHVSLFFQHENQELANFVNVTITGKAVPLTTDEEIKEAVNVIGQRNVRFKERIAENGLGNSLLYRVEPTEVKVLDFKKGIGPNAIEIVPVH